MTWNAYSSREYQWSIRKNKKVPSERLQRTCIALRRDEECRLMHVLPFPSLRKNNEGFPPVHLEEYFDILYLYSYFPENHSLNQSNQIKQSNQCNQSTQFTATTLNQQYRQSIGIIPAICRYFLRGVNHSLFIDDFSSSCCEQASSVKSRVSICSIEKGVSCFSEFVLSKVLISSSTKLFYNTHKNER